MQRLKILISAHEFSPGQGSECSEGWNIVTRLAKYHDVTVIYASGSQFDRHHYHKKVNEYINQVGEISGLTFINVDQPVLTGFLASVNSYFSGLGSIGLPFLYFAGYRLWQKSVYKKVIKLCRIQKFHIVHQLTQITFREPGYLWKLGIPFVWGPTGGTSVLPGNFMLLLSRKARIFENLRTYSNRIQTRSPRVLKAIKHASLIYAFSNEDAIFFKNGNSEKVRIMLDSGTLNDSNKEHSNRIESKITGLWCGQLIERKAPSILLNALSLSQETRENIRIVILGSGPLSEKMRKLASDLKLNNIEWISSVDHKKVSSFMQQADFLIHTSLREATSNVIPEALSNGIPVICHDVNGMSIAINDTCGIKIPFQSPELSVEYFNKAMIKILYDKQFLSGLKHGARMRSRELSWDMMAKTIAEDYSELLALKTIN